ncbi:MAG: TerB family tellurite resistance protein [Rubrivivax sp.]|nr:TerB family tellurite resistance protein [Rubrivivax sp.]
MLKTLTELAEATAGNATDLYTFTSCIERHVMWRIADLLHVPQGSYQAARQRAEQARCA